MWSSLARRVASRTAKPRMTTPPDETMISVRRLLAASFERRCTSTSSRTTTTTTPTPNNFDKCARHHQVARRKQHQHQHNNNNNNNNNQYHNHLRRMMGSSTSNSNIRSNNNSPVGWKSLLLLIATGSGVLFFFENEKKRRMKSIAENQKGVGKAAVGGPFELINAATNKKFTDKDLLGNFSLIYFGFTTCPDICPDELEKMAEVIDIVEKETEKQNSNPDNNASSSSSSLKRTPLVPVFISIDPERDTAKVVKEYVKEFHPKLIGLTGSKEQCAKAARAYRVYYHKTNESSKDYLVDHSIIMYLIDKNGDFVAFYGKNYEARPMAMSILEHMSSPSSK